MDQLGSPPPAAEPPRGSAGRLVSPGRVIAFLIAGVGLYVVWPSLVAVFASADDLTSINPMWFVVMVALEVASFLCIWGLIGLCLGVTRWLLVGTSQLAGNSLSRIVPGGTAAGAALQYRMLAGGGLEATRIATGLTAVSLINVATLFAMPVLSLPAIIGGVAVDRGLARAAWLGAAVFVLLFSGGAVLLLADRPVERVGQTIQRLHNALLRRRPRVVDLPQRLRRERDSVRATLGKRWGQAILRSAGNVLFDYLALVAALVASGARPRASLVLLAYVAAIVLGMIPITPGGLGFVEAGLTGMLVLAGVPVAQATLATFAYRLASYWLPLAAGPVAYALYRRRAATWRARSSPAAEAA
jgi:uncharacterized protein (TIRG00374 family)